MKKQDFIYISNLLKKEIGWEVLEKDYYAIDKKAASFVSLEGYANIDSLIHDIKFGKKLLTERLVEYLVPRDSSFFRDYEVFKRFENVVLPNIKEAYSATKKINIWSCGCGGGQEVYSVLMSLKKTGFFDGWKINVVGTDFSSKALAIASKGVYNNFDIQTGMNIKEIFKHFVQRESDWQIQYDISQYAEFRKYNIMDDLFFKHKFDIVFCRNVLKYFNKDLQKQTIAKIRETQNVGGLLYCGINEEIFGIEQYYDKVTGFECLYQAKEIEKAQSYDDCNEKDEKPTFKKPEELKKMF